MRPEVRAVLVTDGGRLVGVITRKTLVREVVAPGRDPRTTTLREIAEAPNATIDSAMPLAEAFALLEEQDLERVPVVEDGTGSSASSRARSCSGGSPRTSRRRSPRRADVALRRRRTTGGLATWAAAARQSSQR